MLYQIYSCMGFPCGSAGNEPACNAGDLGSIPELGRSPGEGKGYPLQYSGRETSMDCIIHGITKTWTRLSNFYWVSPCLYTYIHFDNVKILSYKFIQCAYKFWFDIIITKYYILNLIKAEVLNRSLKLIYIYIYNCFSKLYRWWLLFMYF